MKKIFKSLIITLLVVGFSACSTSDLDPTLAQIKDLSSISKVDDLTGLMKGALNRMTSSAYYGRDFIINDEIRGENVFANGNSGRFQTTGNLEYIPTNEIGVWEQAYAVIAVCNIILQVDVTSLEGDQALATHIQGQALMLRALAHFDILRNHGQQHVTGGNNVGIPYVTTYGDQENLFPSRATVDEVRTQIYADLTDAFGRMSASFNQSPAYPNQMAARAIESRVALYFGEWSRAESAAEAVVNSNAYSIIPGAQYVASWAQDGSSNSVFELAFSDIDNLGGNSLGFIYRGAVYGDIEVLPNVSSLYDVGDVRAGILGMEGARLRNMGKYPELNGWDNVPIIRYEEVILNLAEAQFEQANTTDALTNLNLITAARSANPYASATKANILLERRKELIFEGLRFFDISRTGSDIPHVGGQGWSAPVPYGDHRYAFPIPLSEMDANSSMTQNQGYN